MATSSARPAAKPGSARLASLGPAIPGRPASASSSSTPSAWRITVVRGFALGILRRSARRSGTGGAESLLLPLALGRRCRDEAPHLQDHPGRTVSEATEPACTGVTGGVRAFLSQFTPALERDDDQSHVWRRYLRP